MDKITRLLFMFSRLMRGEKINKQNFCLETECLERTFDRDIEDIRLFLSEQFYPEELIYSRKENNYYLSYVQGQPLSKTEYMFLEQLLLDTKVLRRDELAGLLYHLQQNTENIGKPTICERNSISEYREPLNAVALLKLHGDLQFVIRNQDVISVRYKKADGNIVDRTMIPCCIKYDLGYLYLIAYHCERTETYAAYFRIDRIESFLVLRKQTKKEIERVHQYIENYADGMIQMYGGRYCEILVRCNQMFYPYIYNKFRNLDVIAEEGNVFTVKIKAFEEGFVKWLLSQSTEMLTAIEPESTVQLIKKEIEMLKIKYCHEEEQE